MIYKSIVLKDFVAGFSCFVDKSSLDIFAKSMQTMIDGLKICFVGGGYNFRNDDSACGAFVLNYFAQIYDLHSNDKSFRLCKNLTMISKIQLPLTSFPKSAIISACSRRCFTATLKLHKIN